MPKEEFLSVFDRFVGNEIPEIIIKILTETGFDTKCALNLLTKETIAEIEEYVNANRSMIANSIYEKKSDFKFLPGHRSLLLSFPKKIQNFNEKSDDKSNCQPKDFSFILKSLIETVELNAGKHPKATRYNEVIKYFSLYIYLLCGRACYETLSANLPIPKINTILSYVSQNKQRIIEGELRCEQLLKYLESLNAKKSVWLSEDATGIVSKVEYDTTTNQLIGLVLPINAETGMPISFSFKATSHNEIQRFMEAAEKSKLLYVVMAQPLIEHAPPFVLQLFGTKNQFNTLDVVQRLQFTVQELRKFGIDVLGFSADGDVRLLNTMKHFTKFCNPNETEEEILFSSTNSQELLCIQDTIHIATKSRNRLLKPSILLPMGNKIVSVSHLKIMINTVPKDVHGIVMKDICPDDRQNFKSMEKVMAQNVLNALSQHINDSSGTIMYLKLCSEVVTSFNEVDMDPVERVYRIWHATYFFRIWRLWLINSKNNLDINNDSYNETYALHENFISPNAYSCIEINAHNLVQIIRRLRQSDLEDLFLTFLFASQPCEEIFRQLRSMGTINFTKINFSLLEVMHLIGRVEIQNDIIYSKLSNLDIKFPRNKINPNIKQRFALPTDDKIKQEMQRARENAIKDALKFGMEVNFNDIVHCNGQGTMINNRPLKPIEQILLEETRSQDIADCNLNIDPSSPFVEMEYRPGSKKQVRKSTLVWLLSESKDSLSNDRLSRVQGSKKTSSCKRRLNFQKPNTNINLTKNDQIQIGDYCIFYNKNDLPENNNKHHPIPELVIGAVLGFKYIKGRTDKEKGYSWDFASVKTDLPEESKRGINVLASWYHFNCNENLQPINGMNCYHISIENYVGSLQNISFDKTSSALSLSETYLQSINTKLALLINSNVDETKTK